MTLVAILAELERAVAALREAVGPTETTTSAKRGPYKARVARRGPAATHVAKMKAAATRFSRRRSGTRKQAFDLNMRQAVDKLGQTKDVVTSRDLMTAMGLRETQRSILSKRLLERPADFGLVPVVTRGTVNRHNPKTYRITEGGA